jgi:hypothetical protein
MGMNNHDLYHGENRSIVLDFHAAISTRKSSAINYDNEDVGETWHIHLDFMAAGAWGACEHGIEKEGVFAVHIFRGLLRLREQSRTNGPVKCRERSD